MAATVVSLPLPQPHELSLAVDNPADARKRRREILASQRNLVATPDPSPSSAAIAADMDLNLAPEANKRRRVSDCLSSDLPPVVSPSSPLKKALTAAAGKAKKPQMKYDPDVPMTKEEAAAWRREQRRKRNRESAAASRQRQRDRIVELEAEVEEWKAKFDEAMKRIQALDGGAPAESSSPVLSKEAQEEGDAIIMTTHEQEEECSSEEGLFIHSPEALVEEVFRDTTFLISPSQSPRSVSPAGSPIDFSPQVQAVKVLSNVSAATGAASASVSSSEEQEDIEEPKPSKMISRPA